ncbi:MAG: ABC transporter permease, partial [Ignavibacteriaceae bacterium]
MLTLIQIELYKIFRKWRTYIGFIAIGVLVPIIHTAMVFEGKDTLDFMTRNIQQSFVFVGNLLNAYLVSYLILTSLAVHIPFLIGLVAGDLLAGEATAGTYRMLITRPVSRTQIITSKFLAGIIYTNLLILWLAV